MLLFISLLSILGATTSLTPSEIISYTNVYREEQGVAPLHPQDQLMRAAEAKANAMMAANSWSHNTPTETPWQFLEGSGYSYSAAGENLAKDFDDSKDVVQGWLDSSSHRDNLLNPKYTDIGVAVVYGNFQGKENTALVVQFLGVQANTQTLTPNPQIITTPLLVRTVANMDPLFFILGSCIIVLAISVVLLVIKLRTKNTQYDRKPHSSHWHR